MKEMPSMDWLQQIDELFRSKEYAQAETLAAEGALHFPEETNVFSYLRICAAVRLERIPQALQWLKEILTRGAWYSEMILRQSPSFEPLQGLPEFERLVAISLKQREADLKKGPEHLVLTPENPEPLLPLFLALHGNNGSAVIESNYWHPLVSQGWLLAMVESSQGNWKGGYGWDDGILAQQDLRGCFKKLQREYLVDSKRVLLGGFSFGGQRAIEHALKGTVGAKGFLAFCPYLPDMKELESLLDNGWPPNLRGYFITGELDESRDHSLALASLFRSRGIRCEVEEKAGEGHWYAPDFRLSLARGLEFLFAQPSEATISEAGL